MENYQLEQSEEERVHNSMDYENRILQIVKNGDTEAMKALMNEDRFDMDSVGVMAVNNQKQTEYMMVAFITLATRAAIDGGLNPEKASCSKANHGSLFCNKLARSKTLINAEL